ncbi:MAG: hypothetical protein AUI11_01915 [Acidobacteria bacterium 13_2_20CM_2_66_4]|nr:MAG: hypothetical protein AUI11_01915 [Acidobacteria bacterium 13_2_20CM_2_66_4]
MKPSSDLIIVLFPAPFGPSSPTAPPANAAVTSRSAAFLPYITVTVSSVTTGATLPVSAMHLIYTHPRIRAFRAGPARRRARA